MNDNKIFNIAVPIFFILLWSSGYIFVEKGLQYCSPLLFLTLRFFLASVILFIITIIFPTKKNELKFEQVVQLVITGSLIQGAYLGFFFLALFAKISPGILAIVLGVQPLLVALFERNEITKSQILGLLVGFIGLLFTVLNIIGSGKTSIVGITYSFLSLFGITAGTLLQKKYGHINIALSKKMLIQYIFSAVIVLICSLLFEKLYIIWSFQFIISLFWVGVIMSVIAFYLYFFMLQSGKATNVSGLLYCVPPVTAILDFLIFGHKFSVITIVGMSLVMISLIVINYRNRGKVSLK